MLLSFFCWLYAMDSYCLWTWLLTHVLLSLTSFAELLSKQGTNVADMG